MGTFFVRTSNISVSQFVSVLLNSSFKKFYWAPKRIIQKSKEFLVNIETLFIFVQRNKLYTIQTRRSEYIFIQMFYADKILPGYENF